MLNCSHDKRTLLWKMLPFLVCLLAVGTATYAVSSLQITGVTPDDGTWLNERSVPITVQYAGPLGASGIYLDGHALPTQVLTEKKELAAVAADLADGPHELAVHARRPLGIGQVERTWRINVDRSLPVVTVENPPAGAIVKDRLLKIEGRTKSSTRMTVRVFATGHKVDLPTFTSDASGGFSAVLTLADGRNRVRVDALDRAGNRGHLVREVTCEPYPPTISDVYPAPDAIVKQSPDVVLTARVTEKGSGIRRAFLTVDGHDSDLVLPAEGGEAKVKLSGLPEGVREAALEVEDRAGWKVRREWRFLVDTTETFGVRPMTWGARGRDALALQKRLIEWGVLDNDHTTSVYDDATRNAVQQFQASHHIDVDGAVGFATIGALSPKIIINLSSFTLSLMNHGKKVKSYGIACGMPAYPTPTGRYRVTYLEKNPTWIPPKDSVWAKEAKVTPPGPGNPLGTRWIGLDSNAVGIHGTPAAWTIGSRASHGCIRMRIPDVEDLFGRINPGSQVSIAWGQPKH